MSTSPFFSIITPTYNRASFLPEMIRSVSEQTFQDYEHIIVDDGSTDGTEELITRLMATHPKIVYIKQQNKGRSAARNVGIDRAKGDYVCFLDSDDEWSSGYLSELKKRSVGADFLATRMIWVNGVSGERTERPIEAFSHTMPQKIIELQIGMNACIKRDHFSKCRFNEELSINEDFELWIRMICENDLDVIAVPESHYLVTTPEVVGEMTFDLLEDMLEVQEGLKRNPLVSKRIATSFWDQRSKSILLRKIRVLERTDGSGLGKHILQYLLSYPKEPVNSSLAVMLLYNLPGGGLLKSLVAKIKSLSVK